MRRIYGRSTRSSAHGRGDAPTLDLEMAMLLEHDVGVDANDFYIEARINGALKPLRFITADRDDRNAWVQALSSVLQTARGLALLQTTQVRRTQGVAVTNVVS